ncbi:MAG: hypothetical protein J7L10_07035 [Methanomicrobia archaeon]|nr:hypothetical protein [Methanomicrobia archaeon]
MNKKNLIIGLVGILCIASGYVIYQNFQETSYEKVKIQTDRDSYTPIMSSVVGIGLVPIYISERDPETVKFHWHTNYGHFVSWESQEYKVIMLGIDVINNGEKIYWSYSEMSEKKPSVHISLTVEDAISGEPLVESTLEIEWGDKDIAKVKK